MAALWHRQGAPPELQPAATVRGRRAGRAGTCVYLWSAATSRVVKLCELGSSAAPDSVSSVSWSGRGSYLAIGTNNNQTQIWDANKSQLCANPPRPAALACIWVALAVVCARQSLQLPAESVTSSCVCLRNPAASDELEWTLGEHGRRAGAGCVPCTATGAASGACPGALTCSAPAAATAPSSTVTSARLRTSSRA